jgi:hypothetical protein
VRFLYFVWEYIRREYIRSPEVEKIALELMDGLGNRIRAVCGRFCRAGERNSVYTSRGERLGSGVA